MAIGSPPASDLSLRRVRDALVYAGTVDSWVDSDTLETSS
jgi:hypothetical protein